MHVHALCQVVQSKPPSVGEGAAVLAALSWTYYAVLNAKAVQPAPDLSGGLNITRYLGALGERGLATCCVFKVVAEAEPSGCVIIPGTAATTGNMAVRLAQKVIGCNRVTGIAWFG